MRAGAAVSWACLGSIETSVCRRCLATPVIGGVEWLRLRGWLSLSGGSSCSQSVLVSAESGPAVVSSWSSTVVAW
jgi:hypothetical protein